MYCQIKKELCIACGLCQVSSPEFFESDEEGIVIFKEAPEKEELPFSDKKIVATIINCPTACLRYSLTQKKTTGK